LYASSFACGVPTTFLRERNAGSLAPHTLHLGQIITFSQWKSWCSYSVAGKWGLLGRHGEEQLCICAQWGIKPPQANRVAEHGLCLQLLPTLSRLPAAHEATQGTSV
jgi:hypothetical protein